ncbi:MAG TPA: hypothetical protein PKG81_06105, partial [Candidatus Omnitrophota bacterium]|nr:hypothetical protein [Candidatus Omnitrophota bacterium]
QDPTGAFKNALVSAVAKALYLDFSLDEIEKYKFDPNADMKEAAAKAEEMTMATIDSSLKAAAKKGGIYKGQDLRGVAAVDSLDDAVEINYEVAFRLGQSLAKTVMEKSGKSNPTIGVGKDVRISSPKIQKAFIKGVREAGGNVRDFGFPYMSTPMASFAAGYFTDLDAAVEITASHNDWRYGGVKVVFGKENMKSKDLQVVTARAAEKSELPVAKKRGTVEVVDLMTPYRQYVKEKFISLLGSEEPFKGLTIAVDGAGGVYGFFADIVEELGGKAIRVNCTPNGYYPSHIPNPVEPSGIKELVGIVKDNPGSIGVSFDSDGDRIAFVAEGGREVSNNEILCLLAQGTDKPMVINSRATLGVYDEMIKSGSYAKKARAGYAFIKQMARSLGSDVAGEESGHFMFGPDFVDDGIMTAGRIFGVIARKQDSEGKNFAMSANETGYNKYVSMIDRIKVELKKQSEKNKAIPNDQWKDINQSIINKLIADFSSPEAAKKGFWLDPAVKKDVWKDETKIDGEVDGCMVFFGRQENGLPKGWALYRPSLSQPDKVYIDIEADTPQNAALLAAELRTALAKAIEGEDADLGSLTDLLKVEDIDKRIDRTVSERAVRIGEVQTKKAPGTSNVTITEKTQYDDLCDKYGEKMNEQDRQKLIGNMNKVFDKRGPPNITRKLRGFIDSGVLQIRVVDLEKAQNEMGKTVIPDARFFPRSDKRVMGLAAFYKQSKQDGRYVSTIYIPKEMLPMLLQNEYLAASTFVHEYVERFLPALNGMSRHGYAAAMEETVSSNMANDLGLSEYTLFYLQEAQATKNLDYLYYILENYSPQKDPTGALLLYLHERIYETQKAMGSKTAQGSKAAEVGHDVARYLNTPKKIWLWYRNQLEYEPDPIKRQMLDLPVEMLDKTVREVFDGNTIMLGVEDVSNLTAKEYLFKYSIYKMKEINGLVDNIISSGKVSRKAVEQALFQIVLKKDLSSFSRGTANRDLNQDYLKEECDYPSDYPETMWMPRSPVQLEDDYYIRQQYDVSLPKTEVAELERRVGLVDVLLDNTVKGLSSKENMNDNIQPSALSVIEKHLILSDELSSFERKLGYRKTEKEFFDEFINRVDPSTKEVIPITKGVMVKEILSGLLSRRADVWIAAKVNFFTQQFLSGQIETIQKSKPSGKIIVGIIGPGGAGKSTIVKMLRAAFKEKYGEKYAVLE